MSRFEDLKFAPIPPIPSSDGWKQHPLKECGEKLVPLGPFLSPGDPGFSTRIFQDAIYWSERKSSPYRQGELNGALLTPFAREGAARKLAKAAASLPEGYAFLIWDSYRPLAVQEALYDNFYQQLISRRGLDPNGASKEAQRYISIPSADPTRPSPHNTGGAVDLTIIKFHADVLERLRELDQKLESSDAKTRFQVEAQRMRLMAAHSMPLNMGTPFDAAVPDAALCFYEDKSQSGQKLTVEETEILQNRRIFYHLMRSVGFSSYREEWWHKDCGNQLNAIQTGVSATYGTAEFSEESQMWEYMRLEHYEEARRAGDDGVSCHPIASRLEVL